MHKQIVCVCCVCIIREVSVNNWGGFPGSSDGKESAYKVGNPGSIPGLGKSPGEGKGYPLQYSGLENSTDCRGCKFQGVAKSLTGLSDFHFHLMNAKHILVQFGNGL